MMEPVFVKICGLSEPTSLRAAVEAGADAVGFVLTRSPRQVDPAAVRRLAAEVPDGVLTVAVLADEPTELVRRLVGEAGVGAVQLHGDHPPEHFAALRDLGLTLVRATALPKGPAPVTGDHGEDLLILDSATAGSGEAWDWSALPADHRPTGRWMVAGGLSPDNVADAVSRTGAWGVDVSSGVESRRGVKDPELVRQFVARARAAVPQPDRR